MGILGVRIEDDVGHFEKLPYAIDDMSPATVVELHDYMTPIYLN